MATDADDLSGERPLRGRQLNQGGIEDDFKIARHRHRRDAMKEPTSVKRVAVLGAGTIGGSWVAWLLAGGMQVTVWHLRAEAADFVRRYVADAWPAMARLSMTADASPDAWRFCATAAELFRPGWCRSAGLGWRVVTSATFARRGVLRRHIN
jgi:3-hydroxyacyl-CoA dehydrogenase, NAD binding domain